jgi:hypothetical protein
MTQADFSAKTHQRVFICGSALRGQPDHQNLQDAVFVSTARTAPRYRLHAAVDGWHPAIYDVVAAQEQGLATGIEGMSIPGELYDMTIAQYDYLVANEPPHMYPAPVILDNGETAIAMLYPQALIQEHQWPDISEYGGWAAYKAASQPAIASVA